MQLNRTWAALAALAASTASPAAATCNACAVDSCTGSGRSELRPPGPLLLRVGVVVQSQMLLQVQVRVLLAVLIVVPVFPRRMRRRSSGGNAPRWRRVAPVSMVPVGVTEAAPVLPLLLLWPQAVAASQLPQGVAPPSPRRRPRPRVGLRP